MYKIIQIGCGVYLCALSMWDIRYRKLPLPWLLAGIGGAMVCCLLDVQSRWVLALGGAGVGMLFILTSKLTKEALGYGDSLLILGLGGFVGFWNLLSLLTVAFFLSAMFAAAALALKRFRKNTAFAFVPFLTAAYLALLLSGEMVL